MLLESTVVSNSSTSVQPTTHGFEPEANDVINRALTTIAASLSLLGASFIIGTFIAWKDFRSTSRRILVYISISDFFIAGGHLFGVWHRRDDSSVCKSQSFVSTCASLCSFFWTTFLAIFMYTVVVKKKANKAEIMLKFYHIIGWGVPLVITGTALGLGKLGNDNDLYSAGWCWIDSKLPKMNKNLWMLISGKAWEVTAVFVSSTFYLMLKYHIRKEVSFGKLSCKVIRNPESGIRNPGNFGLWNPEPTALESGIQPMESGIQNPGCWNSVFCDGSRVFSFPLS